MKAYLVTVLVIDHDGVDEDGTGAAIANTIEGARYPNHCIAPRAVNIVARDIGKWSDAHPLNHRDTFAEEVSRIFEDGHAR